MKKHEEFFWDAEEDWGKKKMRWFVEFSNLEKVDNGYESGYKKRMRQFSCHKNKIVELRKSVYIISI